MLIVAVKNTSGSTISAGQVVYQTDYLRPQQLPIVALASAAAISTAEVLGICVWEIADNETGPIAVSGDVYPIDTSIFSAINDKVYLSDTPGAISTTSGTIPAVIGTVKVVGAAGTINTTGTINIPTFLVSGISPSSGPTAGGTAVTITGIGFVSVTEVSIGGTPCDPATVVTVDANTITAVTPAGSAGAQDVIVTASAGSETLTGGFTYVTAPAVTIISPTSGVTTGGTAVTITGTDFLSAPGVPGASTVTIGGVTCTGIDVISSTSIEADTPIGTGAQDVVVTTPYGTGTLAGGFTYVAAPTVISITPNSGNYLGGTSVTIAGTDFLASPGVPGAISVTIGGVSCTGISYPTSSSIIATSPAGTPGVQDVEVVTNYGTGTLVGGFTYTTYSNVKSMQFSTLGGGAPYSAISTSGDWPELATSDTSVPSGTGYSVSYWVKMNTQLNNTNIFDLGTDGGNKYRLRMRCDTASTSQFRIYEGNADSSSFSYDLMSISYLIIDDEWHHHVFTSEGTGLSNSFSFYIDGQWIQSFNGKALSSGTLVNGKLQLATSGTYGMAFNLDEFSVFSAVLSAAEVTTLYNSGAPTNLNSWTPLAELKHWWRMGDGSGDTATDIEDQIGSWDLDTAAGTPVLSTDRPYVVITSVTPYYGLTSTATSITIAGYNFDDVTGVTIGGAACGSVYRADTNTITATTPTSFSSGTTEDLIVITANGSSTLTEGFVYTASVPAWANASSMLFGASGNISTKTDWPELSDPTTAYSVSFWAKVDPATLLNNDRLFSLASINYKDRLSMVCDTASTSTWRIYEGEAGRYAYSTSIASISFLVIDDLWHHYVIASPGNGGTYRFYMDGYFVDSAGGKALASDPLGIELWVNARRGGNSAPSNIDEFAIFRTELSAANVTTLYNNGTPYDIASFTGIEHYWRLGDGIGDTASIIRDQVGSWNLNYTLGSPALDTDVPYVYVTSITPYNGLVSTATTVTIKGKNFASGVTATIGGAACTSVNFVDSTTITVDTPASISAAGAQDLIVTVSGKTGTLPGGFVFRSGAVPAWSNTYSMFFDAVDDSIFTTVPWPELSVSNVGYSVSFWAKVDLSSLGNNDRTFSLVGKDGEIRIATCL